MEIVKGMKGDQDEVVVDTKIISHLLENIEEEKVKTLIECFNPAIRNSPEFIKEQMLDCSVKWENRKEVFMGAISYIVHSRQDSDYKEEQLKDMEMEKLSEILVREIENRMPKFCRKCEEWYIVKFNNQPEMHCMWCRVGMHDCIEMKELSKCPGMKWLCTICEPTFIEHFLPKLDQFSLFDGFKIDKTKNKISDENKNNETVDNREERREVVEIIVVDEGGNVVRNEEDNQERTINETRNDDSNNVSTNQNSNETRSNDITNSSNNQNSDEARNNDNNNNNNNDRPVTPKEVCWYWKNRKCRYTTDCKQAHPEQCKEMLETGRCHEDRCKLIHVKICRNLFFKHYCPRGDSCWFVHPSKINNNQNNQNPHNNSNGNNNDQGQNFQNFQNQNMRPPSNGNVNRSFLEPHYPQATSWNQATDQNQPMVQIMQNMLEKITRMETKMINLEMERRVPNYQ